MTTDQSDRLGRVTLKTANWGFLLFVVPNALITLGVLSIILQGVGKGPDWLVWTIGCFPVGFVVGISLAHSLPGGGVLE